jgi:pimeloyl-ACP methyl ester carboxylesterase
MNKKLSYLGNNIHYRITGTGKPVVLVHGFGEDGKVWDQQVDHLRDEFQLLIPDLPGSGKSAMIGDMSMEGMAEMLKAIIDEEQLQNVVLIGHSMGGYITLAFAEKHSKYLEAFGLFHSSAYPDNEDKKTTRRKGIAFIREHGAFEFLKTSTPNLFSSSTKSERKELVDEFINSLSDFSAEALIAYYEAMMKRPDRTEVLKQAKVPVLFIIGEHDNAIPMEDVLKQTHLPETADIHILQRSGHMGMLEETAKSNEILRNFVLSAVAEQ